MDCKVDPALSQRLFNLFGEYPLRAGQHPDLRKCDLLQPVPGRLDDLNLDLVALGTQQARNMFCLPKSQLRSTASNAQLHRRVSTPSPTTAVESASTFAALFVPE